MLRRRITLALAGTLFLVAAAPRRARAQDARGVPGASGVRDADPTLPHGRYWRRFALGFAASILAHEGGHIGTSMLLGKRPSFGFDKGRPTVYSGIDAVADPHDQFLFSSAGLTVQSVLDETILDVPHRGGGAFERGVLAGGIATTAFYLTIGRNGKVSDVEYMQRTSSLSKTDITLIYGSIAALHVLRIAHDGRYANFFARPMRGGGMRLGMRVE